MLNNHYEIVEGVVDNLVVFDDDVNYLANADQHSRTAGIVSVLQAAVGAPGAVHSAQAASDSGDPVEAFTMDLGGQPIQGSFWRTTFKNGDHVKAIGSRVDGVFNAVAVTSPADRVIWMQPHCERGVIEQRKYLIRNSLIFVLVVFAVLAFLVKDKDIEFWFYLVSATSLSITILFFTVVLSWKDLMTFAHCMSRVGASLALESPDNINLVRSTRKMIKSGKPELPMGVYYY
jgi:hypothetical protein